MLERGGRTVQGVTVFSPGAFLARETLRQSEPHVKKNRRSLTPGGECPPTGIGPRDARKVDPEPGGRLLPLTAGPAEAPAPTGEPLCQEPLDRLAGPVGVNVFGLGVRSLEQGGGAGGRGRDSGPVPNRGVELSQLVWGRIRTLTR